MGSSASKATRTAVPRKYPTRAAGASLPHETAQRPARPLPGSQQTAPPQPRPAQRPAGGSSDGLPTDRQQPSLSRNNDIRLDGADPNLSAIFSDRLRQLGTVTPKPAFSPLSASGQDPQAAAYSKQRRHREKVSLSVFEARRRLQQDQAVERADEGSGSPDIGREFLSASTLKEILELRAQGISATTIEQRLRLKAGVVARLGRPGLVEAT